MNATDTEDLEFNISNQLVKAIEEDNLKNFRYLINLPIIKNSDIRKKNSLKRKTFYYTQLFNNFSFYKELFLDKEMDAEKIINSAILNHTPMMVAACYGDLNFIKFLLNEPRFKNIININAENEMKENLFLVACREGQAHIVEYIIKEKNNLNININQFSMFGWNGLMYASQNNRPYNYLNTVKYLLTNSFFKFDINKEDLNGWNSLMFACNNKNIEMVKYLLTSSELQEKADINQVAKNGLTPLKLALSSNDLELINFFIIDLKVKIDLPIRKWLENRMIGENKESMTPEEYEQNLYTLNYIKSFVQHKKLTDTLKNNNTNISKQKI